MPGPRSGQTTANYSTIGQLSSRKRLWADKIALVASCNALLVRICEDVKLAMKVRFRAATGYQKAMSIRRLCPAHRNLAHRARKVRIEPVLTNAAGRMNVRCAPCGFWLGLGRLSDFSGKGPAHAGNTQNALLQGSKRRENLCDLTVDLGLPVQCRRHI